VIRVLDCIAAYRDYPKRLRQDNDLEFIAHAITIWAQEHGVKLGLLNQAHPLRMHLLNN